jgi:hypothetical protein
LQTFGGPVHGRPHGGAPAIASDARSRVTVCRDSTVRHNEGRVTAMKYRVHRFDIRMSADQAKLEQFLNGLQGEVVAIIPNVTVWIFWAHRVDFLLIVEKVG